MRQEETEITLARQLAARLPIPIFIVDSEGSLLFYNKAAEVILGRQFDQTGELTAGVWSRIFVPTDEHGTPLLPDDLPLMITLREQRPAHSSFWISGIDNIRRHIEVAAVPLMNEAQQFLGTMAMFWDISTSSR